MPAISKHIVIINTNYFDKKAWGCMFSKDRITRLISDFTSHLREGKGAHAFIE